MDRHAAPVEHVDRFGDSVLASGKPNVFRFGEWDLVDGALDAGTRLGWRAAIVFVAAVRIDEQGVRRRGQRKPEDCNQQTHGVPAESSKGRQFKRYPVTGAREKRTGGGQAPFRSNPAAHAGAAGAVAPLTRR